MPINFSIRRLAAALTVLLTTVGMTLFIPAAAKAAGPGDRMASLARAEYAKNPHSYRVKGTTCNFYTGHIGNADGCRSGWGDDEWCADFVHYIWQQTGGVADLSTLSGWAESFKTYGIDHGTWHPVGSGYVPRPGDAAVHYDDNGHDGADHVGMVVANSGGTVTTIDGNWSDQVSELSPPPRVQGYTSPVVAGFGGAARDVTGDGVDDVVGRTADVDGGLYVYPGNGNGTLASRRVITASGWGGIDAIAVGDFTGDGHADVVGRVAADGSLNLYPGNGAGGLYSPRQVGTGWGAMVNIVAGDFTGDGNADLIARRNDGGVFLYAGNGSGAFGAPQTLADPSAGWGNQLTIVGGDFNGDGHGDLVAETADYKLLLYTGHGVGGFNASVQISNGWGDMTAIIPGDFNNDGRTDVLGRSTDGTLRLYLANASGVLGSGTVLGTGWNIYNLFQS